MIADAKNAKTNYHALNIVSKCGSRLQRNQMTIDIKAIRAAAEAATPQPWIESGTGNMPFICLMTPATVIAVCDELERLRLPDDWYPESKDWRESHGERGHWLRMMYEQAKSELEQLRAELDKQMGGNVTNDVTTRT